MNHEYETMMALRLPKVSTVKSREKENFASSNFFGKKETGAKEEFFQRCFSNGQFLSILKNRMDRARKYLN